MPGEAPNQLTRIRDRALEIMMGRLEFMLANNPSPFDVYEQTKWEKGAPKRLEELVEVELRRDLEGAE